ncbi:MAG TPA: YetF domain-containing protein [Acidimicrobiales bacterium]|jgi:uncharacterized membrane protein YcaP (DUF421 family)
MSQLFTAHWEDLGWVAAKAALLFGVAVIGLRIVGRRTLAQLSVYDFVTAVAVGAIVGRVPNASSTSFVAGAVTLTVLLALHRLLSLVRRIVPVARLLDHRPVVLVRAGIVDHRALRRTQLTGGDLSEVLRSRGVADLHDIELVIFEPNGDLSIINPGQQSGDLVSAITNDSGHG